MTLTTCSKTQTLTTPLLGDHDQNIYCNESSQSEKIQNCFLGDMSEDFKQGSYHQKENHLLNVENHKGPLSIQSFEPSFLDFSEEKRTMTKSGRHVKHRFSLEQMQEIAASESKYADDPVEAVCWSQGIKKADNLITRQTKKCRFCNQVITSESRYHMIDEHGPEYALTCPLCIKTDIENIHEHLKSVHFHLQPFPCLNCKRTLYGLKAHDKHLKKCVKNRCNRCKKLHDTKEMLKAHVCEKKPQKACDSFCFPCDICNTPFFARNKTEAKCMLRRHKLQVHFPENRPNKCSLCSKAFTTKQRLEKHLTSHSDKRLYTCDFPGCCKKFKTKTNLNQHKCFHFPKLICHNCGLKFPVRTILKKHMTKCMFYGSDVTQQ